VDDDSDIESSILNYGKTIGILSLPVIVAALGYFVDIYDLLLFTIVRVPSLQGL
jgi:hypothetical protein